MFRSRLLAASAVLALTATPAFANLVTNGSFATGDFTGWTVSGSGIQVDQLMPNTGDSYDAEFSPAPTGTLSQLLATVTGDNYVLSLALIDTNQSLSDTTDTFAIALGGFSSTVTGDQTGSGPGYANFTFDIPASAISGNDTLSFQATALDPNSGGTWNLDNVAVTPASVPEPGAAPVLATGLFALGALRLRRRRRRA